jgi:peptidoglycan hydrolase-like protein with peptidoglycan-binding domain
MRRTSKALIGLLVAGLAAGAGAWAVERGSQASATTASTAPATATATITRTDVVATEQDAGTLGFDQPRTVNAGLQGTITGLPEPGTVVRRGQALYAVNLQPVTLFYGPVPASRTLSEGVSDGPDVKELEQNLAALGDDPDHAMTIDDHFSAATASAVDRWQEALGRTQTGTVAPGDAVFLPGAVRIATHHAELGDQVGPGRPLTDVTSTTRIATVNLPADDAAIASVGGKVTLELPSGTTTRGTVTKIGKVATVPPPSGNQAGTAAAATSSATIPVTIRVDDQKATGSLDQAPVTVDFTKQVARHALAVPVTALVTLAQGGFAVDVVEGAAIRRVPVQTGLFATSGQGTGLVAISGSGIAAGERVVVPQ